MRAKLSLPEETAALAALAGSPGRLAQLAAGLVRVSHNSRAAADVTAAADA